MYNKGKEAIAGSIDLTTSGKIKLRLVTSSYTFSQSHVFLSDAVTAGATAAASTTDQVLGVSGDTGLASGVTVTNGVLGATRDPKWSSVTGGSTVTGIIAYYDTGTASTSNLLCFIDTTPSGALSIVTNGGDITINLDNGTVITGLFAI